METGTMEPYEITSVDHNTTVTLWGPMEYGYRSRVVWAEFGWRSFGSETQRFPVWRIWNNNPRTARAQLLECIDADDDTDIRARLLAYLPE